MDENEGLKALTRSRMRTMWEMAQANGPLSDEDARLAQAMRDHPEYARLWPLLDTLTDADIERDGANPVLHVEVHAIIENQLADGNPPEVRIALEALLQRGVVRHEAIHQIANEFMEQTFYVLRDRRPFDMQAYRRKLSRLTRGPAERPRQRTERKPKR